MTERLEIFAQLVKKQAKEGLNASEQKAFDQLYAILSHGDIIRDQLERVIPMWKNTAAQCLQKDQQSYSYSVFRLLKILYEGPWYNPIPFDIVKEMQIHVY